MTICINYILNVYLLEYLKKIHDAAEKMHRCRRGKSVFIGFAQEAIGLSAFFAVSEKSMENCFGWEERGERFRSNEEEHSPRGKSDFSDDVCMRFGGKVGDG